MKITKVSIRIAPCVYLWKRDGQVIYVGMSRNSVRRMNSYVGKESARFQETDEIEFWTFEGESFEAQIEAAILLESALIEKYKPKHNKMRNSSYTVKNTRGKGKGSLQNWKWPS